MTYTKVKFHLRLNAGGQAVIGHQAPLSGLNGGTDVRMGLGHIPPVILQRLAANESIVFTTLDSCEV